MVKNVVKNVMSINALVQRHLSSTSSSSSFLITAKTPEKTLFQPGFVFYGKKRSKFPKKRFFIQNPFFIQPWPFPGLEKRPISPASRGLQGQPNQHLNIFMCKGFVSCRYCRRRQN